MKGYTVARNISVLQTIFNTKVTFTLSFNSEMKLAGIYMK